MIKPCICCLRKMYEEKLEHGYCKSCLKAGMKDVADDYLKTLRPARG